MNTLGTITQIYGAYDEIQIDWLIQGVCMKFGLDKLKSDSVISSIKDLLEGYSDVNKLAGELRQTGLTDEQLSLFIKEVDNSVFSKFRASLEKIIKDDGEFMDYKTSEYSRPEEIMHNAGIEVDENPKVEQIKEEPVDHITNREMKTFSNAGVSFDVPTPPVIIEANVKSDAQTIEASIENPPHNEPVILNQGTSFHPRPMTQTTQTTAVQNPVPISKGIVEEKMSGSFGIPSQSSDHSLPKIDGIPPSHDVYREEI